MVCALTSEFLLLYGVPAQTLLDEVSSTTKVFFRPKQILIFNIISYSNV